MKLSKRQFHTALKTYEQMYREEAEIIDLLDMSPEWKCGEWINNYYELLSDLCDLEEDPNYGTVLDWFCFETDFGKNSDINKIYDTNTGRTWTISSPDILYDYIMEVELEEY